MTISALSVLGLIGVLHACPGMLQGKVVNLAYGRYHTHAGGIYYRDPRLGNPVHLSLQGRFTGKVNLQTDMLSFGVADP